MPLPSRTRNLVLEGKEEAEDSKIMDTEPTTLAHNPAVPVGDPQTRRQMHDIKITNQIMYLHPPTEDCRYPVLQQLFAWQAVVTSQSRILSTRYWPSHCVHHNLCPS